MAHLKLKSLLGRLSVLSGILREHTGLRQSRSDASQHENEQHQTIKVSAEAADRVLEQLTGQEILVRGKPRPCNPRVPPKNKLHS